MREPVEAGQGKESNGVAAGSFFLAPTVALRVPSLSAPNVKEPPTLAIPHMLLEKGIEKLGSKSKDKAQAIFNKIISKKASPWK